MNSSSYILAFDTSNEVVSIALGTLDSQTRTVACVGAQRIQAHRASNTKLLPAIDAMLRAQGVERSQIAAVACGRGPGSFTGVRICMATAKGIASALEVPLVGVSTPDALAWELQAQGQRGEVLVVADAMRREVYPVRYVLSDEGINRLDPDTVVPAEWCSAALSNGEEAGVAAFAAAHYDLVAGDALGKYAEIFEQYGPLAAQEQWTVEGPGLLACVEQMWQGGACDPFDARRHDPAFALPVYTRLSDAEENERKRLATTEERDLHTGVDGGPSDAQPQLKPLSASDAKNVVALEGQLMAGDAWNSNMLLDDLGRKDRSWWGAFDAQGALVGYAGGQVIDGQLQLFKIAVAPSRQRQGVAGMLLAQLADDARNLAATSMTLEVRAANQAARAFYEHVGLQCEGLRPGYYQDGEDAAIYTGPLPHATRGVAGMELIFPTSHTAGEAGAAASVSALTTGGAAGESAPGSTAATGGAAGESAPGSTAAPGSTTAPASDPALGSTTAPGSATSAHASRSAPLILAIESSCDETAAAVVDGEGNIVSDAIASQIDFHARFGGVVPEIASRKHIEAICGVTQVCLERAHSRGLRYRDLDAIAVTYAPGLVGALVVGVAFAKGAAWAVDIPLVQVNHLEGHLYANKFATPDLQPPMVVSLVSGGHTMLVHVRDWGSYEVLGSTIDDAVGEAFDKVAKALGLGYPGGPIISKLAADGNPKAIDFPRAMLHSGDLRFSLSGLKTAVTTYINQQREAGAELNLPDIAASFQAAVIDVQVAKAATALDETGAREFCLGGGVAANPALRQAYERMCGQRGVRLTMPPASACTDNAAMIALVALDRYRQERFAPLDADAYAHADLEQPY